MHIYYISCTSISSFLRLYIVLLWFYERLTLVLLFANQKKSEDGFCFYEKRGESKASIQCFFCSKRSQRHCTPQVKESDPLLQAPSRKLHSASQQPALITLKCVCEHLGFLLVYFVYPLARCAPSYQKSPREVIFGGLGKLKKCFYIYLW